MLPWLVALLCILAACVGFVAGVFTDAVSSGRIAHSYADFLAQTRGSRFPMRPDIVYWLDGIEDPEPALFFAEQDAKDAAPPCPGPAFDQSPPDDMVRILAGDDEVIVCYETEGGE